MPKNTIKKVGKRVVTVSDSGAAETLTLGHAYLAPGHGPSARGPPPGAIYISATQVCQRYGGLSDMWLHRMLARDPSFPRPTYFGKRRFFRIDELIAWERASALKASHRKTGRPRKTIAATGDSATA